LTLVPNHDGLACNKREPDADCTFEVIHLSDGRISLKGAIGKIVNKVNLGANDAWFACYGVGGGAPMDIIHLKGNQIYLQCSVAGSTFMTNRKHSYQNGVIASSYAGSDCLFTISEPIISKEIVGVVYDLPKAHMWDVPPLIALSTTVRNDSHTSEVVQTIAYSYTRSKVGTWNNAAGVEIGAETSFEAGVPFIASVDLTISVSASYSHEWGGSEGVEETISSSTQITVPPRKKGNVIVLVKNKAMDISFTCKEKILYKDGKTKIIDKKGVYNNVESYHVDVQAGDWEDA
jgi:hypothetical protein